MDNLSEKEQKRRKLIEQIQVLHKEEISVQEISQITGTDRKTVKKYLEGDPKNYVAAMYTDRWKDIPTLYSKAYKVVWHSLRLPENWQIWDMPDLLQMPDCIYVRLHMQRVLKSGNTAMIRQNIMMMEAKKQILII